MSQMCVILVRLLLGIYCVKYCCGMPYMNHEALVYKRSKTCEVDVFC
jgi:hypothetical protein